MLKPLSIAILGLALVVSPTVSKEGGKGDGGNSDDGGGKGGGKGGDNGSGKSGDNGDGKGSDSGSTGDVSSGGSSNAGRGNSGLGNGGSAGGGFGAAPSSLGGLGGSTFGRDAAGSPSTTASLPQASEGRGGEVSLPISLSPVGRVMLSWPEQPRALAPLRSRPGTAPSTVRACRAAIARVARRYGAASVDVASAGPTHSRPTGTLMAPIEVRIVYERRGQARVRQAQVTCELDTVGQVFALR